MWLEIRRDQYYEELEKLPPALVTAHGFLFGEMFDIRTCRVTSEFRPTYSAYVEHRGRFYSGGHLTLAEFRAFKLEDLTS